MAIEDIWRSLRVTRVASQRRIDAIHPCDLYADFAPPDQIGLVAICGRVPPEPRPLRAIAVEAGQRTDGRWSLRLSLLEPSLQPVFAALCSDIIAATTEGVTEDELGSAVLGRLQRWRTLFDRDAAGLGAAELLGLIGELTVLESRLLPLLAPHEAIQCWRGPYGSPQDFLLPTGGLIEVKAANRDASAVRINGLGQLDPGDAPLTLAVVRVQASGVQATGAVSAPRLIARIRERLLDDADARASFESALAAMGWHEHPAHDELAVQVLHIEAYRIADGLPQVAGQGFADGSESFPRLTAASVPAGVEEVAYNIVLPAEPDEVWGVAS